MLTRKLLEEVRLNLEKSIGKRTIVDLFTKSMYNNRRHIKIRLKEECLTEFQTLMLDKLIATFKKMGKSNSN